MLKVNSDSSEYPESPKPKINKIEWFPSHQTLVQIIHAPDLGISKPISQSRYNASSIYEWNINGLIEYDILNILQQMTMTANAYKTQMGTHDKTIAELLIAGFSGQLKGWWDYYLNEQERELILNSYKTDKDGTIILDDEGNSLQDAVATLILTISYIS
ncbi:hypothetical protein C2S53_006743 [Perilla frutescens var. hirtella]|uniref:DUF7746 domain-containing protein n=1 Tax=Perilla frutescens var. hirtella TaxID=608512 RepID=A0AAD4JC28_PERFH|nr:hypothetical protein C2S53_006743 [Perilla frutescens var. hirtella]